MLASCAGLACQTRAHERPALGESDFRALVARDSAVFVFPTPSRKLWEWNVPGSREVGTVQCSWIALWDMTFVAPYSLGQGVEITLRQPRMPERRTGTHGDMLRAAQAWTLTPPPPHLDVAYRIEPESAAVASAKSNLVVVTLRRSSTLNRLLASHPDSIRLEVQLPILDTTYRRAVRVEYRDSQ
jgi:hypothetical protein